MARTHHSAPLYSKVILPLAFVLLGGCSSQSATPSGAPNEAAWPTPQQAVSVQGPTDPVASRLTVWLRLVGGNTHASAKEYADFLSSRPVWPRWQLLKLRMQQALAQETDASLLQQLCSEQQLTYGPALAHCKEFVPQKASSLSAQAKQAWMNGNDAPAAAKALSAAFPEATSPEASWLRFNREEKSGQIAAAKQTIPYLSAAKQQLATARLAFRTNDPSAESVSASVAGTDAADPLLIFDRVRWLRMAKRYDDALHLWQQSASEIERKSGLAIFWRERDALSRELLQNQRDEDAFLISNDNSASGANALDAAFLSGWIALEKLHDADKAELFFKGLTHSPSLITKSRGYYWLGRAHQLAGQNAVSQADYEQAALYAGTFYGQMAAAELDGQRPTLLDTNVVPKSVERRLCSAKTGAANTATQVRLTGSDLAQAAQILASWGDLPHARDFLNLLAQQVVVLPDKLALVKLAESLHIPDIGVAVAHQAGKEGVFLLQQGWPIAYSVPENKLPSGIILGLMRQESSFNPDAVSSSNAIGLMQLKPSTAADMAHKLGMPASAATAAGLHNPQNNMQLGIAYLEHLQGRFGSVVPYIAAAYNGGPTRLARWLITSGDPATAHASQHEMIDWIESIPYSETRNYVQRVWENMTIYTVLAENK